MNENIETYSKMIFLSEAAEKEWNEAPECIKISRMNLLEQYFQKSQAKIQAEYNDIEV